MFTTFRKNLLLWLATPVVLLFLVRNVEFSTFTPFVEINAGTPFITNLWKARDHDWCYGLAFCFWIGLLWKFGGTRQTTRLGEANACEVAARALRQGGFSMASFVISRVRFDESSGVWVVIFRKSGSLLTTETTVLVHDGCGETKIIDGLGESTIEGQVKLAREMQQWVSGASPASV